jgi:hypothetical protein
VRFGRRAPSRAYAQQRYGMEPAIHPRDFSDDALATFATASFNHPGSIGDDDEVSPSSTASDNLDDVWAGIQAPMEDGDIPPIDDPMAFETPEPLIADEPQVASIPDPRDPIEETPELPEKNGWIVSVLCAGIAIVAVCLLLPLAEENHQLAWQREKLKTDLTQLQQQVEVNDHFLKKISNDPTLAERLAQRQMKFIRKGTTILDLPGGGKEEMSPFQLVTLPPPNPIPPYRPLGGMLSAVVRNPHLRLYLAGAGLLLLAAGLVLGGEGKAGEDGQ